MSIVVTKLRHTYTRPDAPPVLALHNVSLTVDPGRFVALIGPTGSGKSTLLQHLNGLLSPPPGAVVVDGADVGSAGTDLQALRRRVGLVFQYPEHQLFADTVAADVAFGPRNLGVPAQEIDERVHWALRAVGLDPRDIGPRSPFALSGGQQRRVALAGVLASRPRYLLLDEPTAGLDPAGRHRLWTLLKTMQQQDNVAVLLVTHDMDVAAHHADDVIVMAGGRIVLQGAPSRVFHYRHRHLLQKSDLQLPVAARLIAELTDRGWPLPAGLVRTNEAVRAIAKVLQRDG